MQLKTGLYDHMVLQRNRSGKSDALFEGVTSASGKVVARISQNGKALRGMASINVGKAAKRKFTGRLRGIPTGGPYDIELSVVDSKGKAHDSIHITDVLVGDVWVLAGQSNMQGVGLLADAMPPHEMVRAYYMDDRWNVATDPIHVLSSSIDEVHCGPNGPLAATPIPPTTGVGPGVAFGQDMHARTGVPQGLLATAHGGTSMAQWDPAKRRQGGKSLYGSMLRSVKWNGGRVAGVVWYQGESDANPQAARVYTDRMKKLVAAMRSDFNDQPLPFVAVQIGRVISTSRQWPAWNDIQDQQYRLPEAIERLAVVPAIDLSLDDNIHISGGDQNRLGKRCAQAMCHLLGPKAAGSKELGPIKVKSVKLVKEPRPAFSAAEITFDNVAGSLKAAGRPMGFSLSETATASTIFKTELVGRNKVLIRSSLSPRALQSASVCHGAGLSPACNITDDLDRSLPVFMDLPLGKQLAVTPYVTQLRTTGWQAIKGDTKKPPFPDASILKKMRAFESDDAFIDLHLQYDNVTTNDPVAYFACKFHCKTKMKLAALVGYDGPLRLWVDGKLIFEDPDGVNPAVIDGSRVAFNADKGEHEIIAALGSNTRRAWGIMLRFERTGVAQKTIDSGKAVLPQLIG